MYSNIFDNFFVFWRVAAGWQCEPLRLSLKMFRYSEFYKIVFFFFLLKWITNDNTSTKQNCMKIWCENFTPKIKVIGMCGRSIQRTKLEIDRRVTELSDLIYLGKMISGMKEDTDMKLQQYSKINGIIKINLAHKCLLV